MSETASATVGSLFTIGYFIFFIFACMSLTKTDTEQIYLLCGHSLREIVMVDVVFGSIAILVFAIVCFFIMECIKDCQNGYIHDFQEQGTVAWTLFIYGGTVLIIGAFSLSRYVDASNKPGCFEILSNTTNGMKSPSANLGEPLLAQVALLYGIIYTIVGSVTSIIMIVSSFVGCYEFIWKR